MEIEKIKNHIGLVRLVLRDLSHQIRHHNLWVDRKNENGSLDDGAVVASRGAEMERLHWSATKLLDLLEQGIEDA